MAKAEIVGAGMHDGLRFQIPANVEVVVFCSRDAEGRLTATLARARDAAATDDEMLSLLIGLAEELIGDVED